MKIAMGHCHRLQCRQIQRQEDDIRQRMSAASDQYRKNVTDTQAIRQEYFNFQLPRIIRVSLLDSGIGIDSHLPRLCNPA